MTQADIQYKQETNLCCLKSKARACVLPKQNLAYPDRCIFLTSSIPHFPWYSPEAIWVGWPPTQGRGSLVGCRLWDRTESDTWIPRRILCFMPQGALFGAPWRCSMLLSPFPRICVQPAAHGRASGGEGRRQALNLHAHVSTSWRRVPPDSGPGAPVGITATLGPPLPCPWGR